MDSFKVIGIVDGNTLEISPNWTLGDGATGNMVKAAGYNAPKTGKRALAIEQKLSIMLQNKNVELDKPDGIEDGKLVCEVYFKGSKLSDYFQEFRMEEPVTDTESTGNSDSEEQVDEVQPGEESDGELKQDEKL
jgi:hypothetical protein